MSASLGNEEEAFGGGFFDRVVAGAVTLETPIEVQDCHSQLRICMQRITDVETINVDLEARLEAQAREYIELESDAAELLTHWKTQYKALAEEAGKWKQLHSQQELRNKKIREQLLRTERELHGILQKKYDIIEYARREERDRIRAEQSASLGLATLPCTALKESNSDLIDRTSRTKIGPHTRNHEWHNPLGTPPQDVRRGRAILALADFFWSSSALQ